MIAHDFSWTRDKSRSTQEETLRIKQPAVYQHAGTVLLAELLGKDKVVGVVENDWTQLGRVLTDNQQAKPRSVMSVQVLVAQKVLPDMRLVLLSLVLEVIVIFLVLVYIVNLEIDITNDIIDELLFLLCLVVGLIGTVIFRYLLNRENMLKVVAQILLSVVRLMLLSLLLELIITVILFVLGYIVNLKINISFDIIDELFDLCLVVGLIGTVIFPYVLNRENILKVSVAQILLSVVRLVLMSLVLDVIVTVIPLVLGYITLNLKIIIELFVFGLVVGLIDMVSFRENMLKVV